MKAASWNIRTGASKRDLMLSAWQRMGHPPIGRRELRQMQKAIADQFGEGAVESPAAIARFLADEGAELRHPEVIEADARWRQLRIKAAGKKFRRLQQLAANDRLTLKQAERLINEMETLRRRFERGDTQALRRLQMVAAEAREAAQSFAKDRTCAPENRVEQAEIAEWLRVWIQTPALFADWIELRKSTPEFSQKFAAARN